MIATGSLEITKTILADEDIKLKMHQIAKDGNMRPIGEILHMIENIVAGYSFDILDIFICNFNGLDLL